MNVIRREFGIDSTLQIIGWRRRTKLDMRHIFLRQPHEIRNLLGLLSHTNNEQTCSQGIQGSGMAHFQLLLPGDFLKGVLDFCDRLVAGPL